MSKQKRPEPYQKQRIQDEIIDFFQQWKPDEKDDFISLEKVAGDPVIRRKKDLAHNALNNFDRYVTGAVLSSKKIHREIALRGSYSEFIKLRENIPNTETLVSLLNENIRLNADSESNANTDVPPCIDIYTDLLSGNGYPSDKLLDQISDDGHRGLYFGLLAIVIYYDLFSQFKQISLTALLRMDYIGQLLLYKTIQRINNNINQGKKKDRTDKSNEAKASIMEKHKKNILSSYKQKLKDSSDFNNQPLEQQANSILNDSKNELLKKNEKPIGVKRIKQLITELKKEGKLT